MKSLYLKAGKAEEVFNDLKDNFNGTLIVDNDEFNLMFQSGFAKGNIQGATFKDGMTYMKYDVFFYEDVRLSVELFPALPIFFTYCFQGTFEHSIGEYGKRKTLKKKQAGILKSVSSVNSIFYFKKNIPVKFSMIGIGTNPVDGLQNNGLTQKLKKMFFIKKEDYLLTSFQNFKITEKIKELNSITQKSIVGNLLKKRILENILETEIEQHRDGFSEMAQAINSFATKGMNGIKSASNLALNFPAELITKFLLPKAGFFIGKLHEEFKTLSNKTLHNFLVFIRVERQRT